MMLMIEIVIQTFLAFFALLFITRLLGRKQVKQLTFFEYINGITFGSIAANLATDLDQSTYQHFVGLILFGMLTGLLSYISIKKRSFQKVVEGEPVLVIQNGKILEKNLKKIQYSIDELTVLLRNKDVFNIEDVKYGLLEIDGDLSIMKETLKKDVKIDDLNNSNNEETLQTEIIIGGQIIYENLKKKNLTGKSLIKMLSSQGINDMQTVFYAALDENNKLYIDKYKDNLNKIDMSENNENV